MAEPVAEPIHRHPGADPGMDRAEALLEHAKERAPVLAALAVIIVLATGGLTAWSSFSEKRQVGAQAALGQLLDDFEEEAREPRAAHEACVEFAKDHRGTTAADHARYLAALWLERADDAEGASEALGELVGDLEESSALYGPVRDAQARLLESAGRSDEAADVLLARIAGAGEVGASEAVVLAAARNLEAAGRVDEARTVLENFVEGPAAVGSPGRGTWARARLASLGSGG